MLFLVFLYFYALNHLNYKRMLFDKTLRRNTYTLCPLFLTIFKRTMCFLVISNEILLSWLFRKKFNLQLFFFPLFHEHLFSPGLPRATRLLETSCLEKITVCVIETMLVTLLLLQMNNARREVSEQIKYKSTQDKTATVLRTYVNDWKNILPLFKS